MTLWFLARAAGLVALLAASVAVGLGAAGSASRRDGRAVLQLVHRSAAVLTLALLGLHAALLVADAHVDVSLGGALVPFTAGYAGFALGLGTLAAYGFVVVALTGALRGRMAGSARAAAAWRAVHVSAYGAWALGLSHGLLAGTDTGRGWAWLVYGLCVVVVAGGVVARLAGAEAAHQRPLARARRDAELVGGGVR
jgi:methionine sulfoxide reductase heme-binding subunit